MTSAIKGPVVIVGGGHNGLVCASYLAMAGRQVQILEARDTIGGGASTTSFAPGYSVSGLAHILHSLNPKVCKDLKLSSAGVSRGAAIDTIALDKGGQHLTLRANAVSGDGLSQSDIDAYTDFKEEFRRYARALEPLLMNKPPRLKDMDRKDKFTLAKLGWSLRFGLGASSMREFLRVGGINIYDVLNEVFDSPLLKGVIAVDAVMGNHMGPRTPTTVLTYLNRLWGESHCPQSIPPGGMGQVTKALAEVAGKAGVSIRTGTKVAQILVEEGRATGVQLESGERIDAGLVISNADAKTTFLDLVGAPQLDAMFAKRIHTTRTEGNVAKLHLAMSALPGIDGLSTEQLGQRLLIAPDMRYVEHAFNHAKYGEYSQQPVLEITIPSIADPSLAPAGHHVMSISASFAPYSLRAGWDKHHTVFADLIIALIEEYAPGFSAGIVARELLTPVDIETQYNITGGHWHHGEMTIDQSFMMRPVHGTAQYDTPISGLFLCGAAAHPGGGVTGVPGHNAAKRILAMGGGL
ncbi:MAG: NAD(P)/FAD-dependent oxidoreductase [Halieaceae bacterium]|jgi:phytoene dehydrogenase-like protein|nr:NAD(P)/FAD-dependent oxidoreductase [Halieaceae bacterium]